MSKIDRYLSKTEAYWHKAFKVNVPMAAPALLLISLL